jgi:predicted RNA polymerase sigma factor
VSKVNGTLQGLSELEKIRDSPSLASYHLFYSTQAEFYMQMGQFEKASRSLEKAIELSPLPAEKELLRRKLGACAKK